MNNEEQSQNSPRILQQFFLLKSCASKMSPNRCIDLVFKNRDNYWCI